MMKNTTKQQLTKHDHPEWPRANLSNTQPKSQLSCAVCGLGFWPRRALGRLEAWVEGGERVWVRPEWGGQVRDVRWGNVRSVLRVFFCEILSCLSRYWHDCTLMPYTLALAESCHISEHVKLPGSVKCPALGQIVSSAYIISTSKRKHSKRLNFPAFLEQNEYPCFVFNPVGSSEKKTTWKSQPGLITECFKAPFDLSGSQHCWRPTLFCTIGLDAAHPWLQAGFVMALSWRQGRGRLCERFALAE